MHLRDIIAELEQPVEGLRLAQGKNISMTGELWGRVDAVAEALDISRSALMQIIVRNAIEDLERDLAEQQASDDEEEELTGSRPDRRGGHEAMPAMHHPRILAAIAEGV